MTLYEKIKALYPELQDADFMDTIRLQNDSDGKGDYIKKWEHPRYPRPTEEQLARLAEGAKPLPVDGAKPTPVPTPKVPTPQLPPTSGTPIVFEHIGVDIGRPDTLLVNLRCPQVGCGTQVTIVDINGVSADCTGAVDEMGLASHNIFLQGLDLSQLEVWGIVDTGDGIVSVQTAWSV